MEPAKSTLGQIIGNIGTILIPPFQRGYEWVYTQYSRFWYDLERIAQGKTVTGRKHFMATILIQPHEDNGKELGRPNRHYISDGQQRTITGLLLYCAMRDVLTDAGYIPNEDGEAGELALAMAKGHLTARSSKPAWQKKMIPALHDRNQWDYVSSGAAYIPSEVAFSKVPAKVKQREARESKDHSTFKTTRMITAYRFFCGELQRILMERNRDTLGTFCEHLCKVMEDKIPIIQATLNDKEDDPQQIFESANTTGRMLTGGESTNSLLTMAYSQRESEQAEMYNNYWFVIQEEVKRVTPKWVKKIRQKNEMIGKPPSDDMTYFLHQVVQILQFDKRNSSGTLRHIDEREIYNLFKNRVMPQEDQGTDPEAYKARNRERAEREFMLLRNYGHRFIALHDPMPEETAVQEKLFKTEPEQTAGLPMPKYPKAVAVALLKLKQIESDEHIPLVMEWLAQYEEAELTEAETVERINLLENLLSRRIITKKGSPAKLMRDTLNATLRKKSTKELKAILSTGYPDDAEITTFVEEISFPRKAANRLHVLLRLEQSLRGEENVKNWPQTADLNVIPVADPKTDQAWGVDKNKAEQWQTHWANFTLTRNKHLSKIWKIQERADETYKINEGLPTEKWTEPQLIQRTNQLKELVLRTWPQVLETAKKETNRCNWEASEPCAVIINGNRQLAKSWTQVVEKLLKHIHEQYPDKFFPCLQILEGSKARGFITESNEDRRKGHRLLPHLPFYIATHYGDEALEEAYGLLRETCGIQQAEFDYEETTRKKPTEEETRELFGLMEED